MISQINNLVRYSNKLISENENTHSTQNIQSTKLTTLLSHKTLGLNEKDFKELVFKFSTDENGKFWVYPTDILIMSISILERIVNKISIKNHNPYTILWIACMLCVKYVASHDYEPSLEFLAHIGGFELATYRKFESFILTTIDWKLEIPDYDYKRLTKISEG